MLHTKFHCDWPTGPLRLEKKVFVVFIPYMGMMANQDHSQELLFSQPMEAPYESSFQSVVSQEQMFEKY